MEELLDRTEQIAPAIHRGDAEAFTEAITTGQQLAITMGNLLEQMQGENCPIVSLLEQYCEIVYRIYESAQDSEIPVLQQTLKEVREALEEQIWSRKTILLLPMRTQDWAGMKPIWERVQKDPQCDVIVAPVPYYYKDYDGSPRTDTLAEIHFPEEVEVTDTGKMTAEYLELLRPEIIVIQNPYDAWNPVISVPQLFYSESLRKYTDRLIYVSPFTPQEYTRENAREYSNMKYYVDMPGVVYADTIIVDSENRKRVYEEHLTESLGEDTADLWQDRIHVMEPEQEKIPEKTAKESRRILYGIGLGTYLEDQVAAGQKIQENLKIFAEYGDHIQVDICLFPETEAAFSKCQCEIREKLAEYPQIQEVKKELIRMEDYDAYYGDPMPLVTDFMQKTKPIMIQDYQLRQLL